MDESQKRRAEFEQALEEFYKADKRAHYGQAVDSEALDTFMYTLWRAMRADNGISWSGISDAVRRVRGEHVPEEALFSLV